MLFLHLVVDGFVTGCAIGVVAVTFSLIYSTTKVFHMAHAGIYSLSGYVAYYLTEQGIPFAVALFGAIAACAVAGALIQHFLYRELANRNATPLVLLIASFGALVMIQNIIAAIFSADILSITTSWSDNTVDLGGFILSVPQVLIVVTSILLFAGLLAWASYTALGKRTRAVADNDFLAEITRLDPRRVHVVIMAVASGLVAFPACLVAIDHGMQPYTGTVVLLTAIIAMIAGGLGNLAGAFVTAIIVSVLQTVSTVFMPGQWSIAATFGLFVVLMIFKPTGLFVRATT
jgi:branched-chain amino acid transport system permease protein